MGTGVDTVLAVCGGGGNDALALIVILVVLSLYLVAALTPIVRADGPDERLVLLSLLVGSAMLGGFVFLSSDELFGGDYLAGFFVTWPLAAAIGLVVAHTTRRTSVGRAVFVALTGNVFVSGGLILLLYASVGIGTGCLD
jgi:hypothetical protein